MSESRKPVRWLLKAGLLASVILNAALVWLVLRPTPPRMATQVAPLAAFRSITARLPADDAAILREAVMNHGAALRRSQQTYESEVERVLAEISREPFDPEATRAAIERARAQRKLAADELIDAVLEALPQMSARGRHALTERTRQRKGED